MWEGNVRRTNSSRGNDKVIPTAHSPDGFDDIVLIVGDDLYPFELDAEAEAVFGEEGGVGIDGLLSISFFNQLNQPSDTNINQSINGEGNQPSHQEPHPQ